MTGQRIFTRADLVRAAMRAAKIWRNTLPRQVAAGRMSADEMETRVAEMEAIASLLSQPAAPAPPMPRKK